MKTSLVTNKLNTRFFITTTKMKLLTLLMVFLSSWGWGQTVTVGSGTSQGNKLPVVPYFGFSYSQQIVLKTDVNTSGLITKLRFYSTGTALTNSNNWTIYLGHTSKTAFSSNTDWIASSAMTQVFSGIVPTPSTTAGWYEIDINDVFVYNNIDNLVVAVDENATGDAGSSSANYFRIWTTPVSNRGIYYQSDATNPDPTSISLSGTRTSYIAQMQLELAPAPTCYTPNALTSSSITYQSATIGWTAPASGTSPSNYEYEVRTSGAAGSGATGLVASGTTTAPTVSASITGLSAATAYSYYVRSNCGGGDYSAWSGAGTFVTGCDIPNNPGAISSTSPSSTGVTLNYTAATPTPTSYILFFTTGASATAIPTLVNGTSYSNLTGYTFGSDSYTCITNSSVSPISLSGGTSNTQYNYFLYSKSSTNSCSGAPYYSTGVTISNVTCAAAPTAPVNSSITVNSATVSWTASLVGGGFGTINYSLEVYTDLGYTNAISGSPFSMGTTTTQNLTGLTASTIYYYRIVANNGVCNSAYLTGSLITSCDVENAPTNIQTFATFTGSAPSPVCWSEATSSAVAAPSVLTIANSEWLNSTGFANTGSNVGVKTNLYGTDSDDWLISNQINLGNTPGLYRLKYNMAVTSYNGTSSVSSLGTHIVRLVISTDGGTTWSSANTIKTYTGSASYSNTGLTEYINLTNYSGIIKIAFVATTSSSTPDIDFHIDDFGIELIPSCFEPTAITISSITNSTATLSWTAPATAPGSGYDVYYSTTNTAPSAGTTPSASVASGTSYAFTGLTSNTTYYSWVRSNCGASDVSLWVASASFTTLQIPATVPYSTNFNTNDFTFVNGTQTNKWAYGTAVGNTGSSIYVSNDNGVTNAYSNGSSSVVQVYRDIAIPAGATIAQFSFDWLGNAESCCDYTRVWLVPVSFFPTAGSQITSGTGRIQVGSNFNSQTTWQTYTNNSLDISGFANTTMRLVFEWRNDGSQGPNPPGAIDNISFKVPYVWTGTTSTDWATTTNWNLGAIPPSTDNIVIPSSGVNIFPVATSLTIAAGATMTLNANAQLTVNGTLTNNGTLTLESGATLVQGTGNTVTGSGTFNVKQALTGAGGATPSGRFWYLGSPVSTANSGVFNAAGNNRLWTYSETALAYNTEITDNTTALSPMQGAVVRLGASETSVFTGGLLNTGDYTSSLTRTGTTDSKRGYTLLSNPYPSYLDWSAAYTAAVATNANISSTIWYRSFGGSNMVFDTYNATGAVAISNSGGTTTQYIPPMQAFWVYNPNDGTSGSLTFSNSMRSHQSNGGLKSSTDFPAFVRLNLENDGAIDQTVLYFDNNAAAGYDNFDSDKMMLANAAQVYSFVDNKKLAINGMKSIKANKQVPLTVEFPTAKSYSFNATEVVMTDGIVILEDRLTKVFQDLTMNPVYNFDAAAGTDADRFVLHFQPNGGVAGIETAADNGIAIVSNASGLVTITLSEELPAMGTIQIIDINGKVIATLAINEQTTTMNINAATGVYHVLVDSSAKVARKKIVITK